MKNYTIELYGWTLDAKAKSINLEEVEQINNLKNDAGAETLIQIKFDIEDTIVSDDNWNILRVSKPFWYLDKSKYWSSYIFDSTKAVINLKSLKKIIKKCIPSAVFCEDFFELDKIKNSTLKVNPSEENSALFECLQITIPFEKL